MKKRNVVAFLQTIPCLQSSSSNCRPTQQQRHGGIVFCSSNGGGYYTAAAVFLLGLLALGVFQLTASYYFSAGSASTSTLETTATTATSKQVLSDRVEAISTTTANPQLPLQVEWNVEEEEEEAQEQLPSWLRAYVENHQLALQQENRNDNHDDDTTTTTNTPVLHTILQYRCKAMCGGTGDRISGIVQAFFMALCTDRLFLLDWNQPVPLQDYLQPKWILWNTSIRDASTILFSKQRNNNNNMPLRIRAVDDKVNEYVLDPYRLPKNKNIIELETNLYLGEEQVTQLQCIQDYRNRFPVTNDTNDFASTTTTTDSYLYRSVFWALFQWSPRVVQSVKQLKQQMKLFTIGSSSSSSSSSSTTSSFFNKWYVAVHVRTGRIKDTNDIHIQSSTESNNKEQQANWARYLECAQSFQTGLQQLLTNTCFPDIKSTTTTITNWTVPIYLAADTTQVKTKFQEWDSTIRTMPDMEIYHLDRTPQSTLQNPQQAALDVFADLKLLMDSTCLVLSSSTATTNNKDLVVVSKFSRMAQWLPPQPRCALVWNDCGPDQVAKQLSKVLLVQKTNHHHKETSPSSASASRPQWCG